MDWAAKQMRERGGETVRPTSMKAILFLRQPVNVVLGARRLGHFKDIGNAQEGLLVFNVGDDLYKRTGLEHTWVRVGKGSKPEEW